jgi:hypothetical protein
VVADPSLEDEAAHEGLGHTEIGGGAGDVEQTAPICGRDGLGRRPRQP